jgi:hypothetical protein
MLRIYLYNILILLTINVNANIFYKCFSADGK